MFTVLPALHLALPPDTTRGRPRRPVSHPWCLSLELCAVLYHISPMALYRLVWACGYQSLVTVLTRCGLPLPPYFLADRKQAPVVLLTNKVYLPTIVSGRVLWHLGYAEHGGSGRRTHTHSRLVPQSAVRQPPEAFTEW